MKAARALGLLLYLLPSAALAQAEQPAKAAEAPPAVASTPAVAAATLQAVTAAGSRQAAPSPQPAPAATHNAAGGDDKAVSIKADDLSLDVQSDTYRAKGDVHVVQDGVSLLADSVIYQRFSDDAFAEGHVLMEKSGDTLKGDRASINMLSHKGEISKGELFIKKSNFHVRGERILKTGDEDYRIDRGTFTTCDGDKPSWRFEARKLDVTLDEFATARDAVFYAGDIPLLYTPYLLFPVKRERQSGLLIPKLGRSTKKGFYISQPYYWAIDDSQDATFNLDLESSRGAGAAVDYRYMRAQGSEGRFRGFGIYDTKVERFRGEIDQNHLELLSPTTTLASSIHLITDRSYYLDYGELAGDYNRQLLESSVSFDHRWERYTVAAEARYTEDLLGANNDTTLQRVPALSFTAAGDKLGPLFFSMDSGFTNFYRNVGVSGERLELHPRLSFYAKPTSALDFSAYGAYRQRFYNSYGAGAPNEGQEVGQADGGAKLSLPLERIYDGQVRHLLIPSLEYGYVQHQFDDDVPFFDYNDRVLGQSIGTWSLASVITGKYAATPGTAPEYRDLVYLRLSQGYQFSGERRDLLTLVDRHHHLTDLMLEGRVSPVKSFSLALDGRYNPIDNNLSTGNIAAEYKGEGTNLASVAYRFSRDNVEYMEGRLAFPLSKHFSAMLLGRYSFDKGGFLESRYALEYKQQCWSVIAAYADRVATSTVSANKEFTINFNLYGIGSLGPVRTF